MRATDAAGRRLLGRLSPLLVSLVVDDVVGAEFLEGFGLGVGGGGRDDAGAGRFGELQREHADSPRSLRQDCIPRLQTFTFHPEQCVPCRQRCAGQGAALLEVQGRRHADQA